MAKGGKGGAVFLALLGNTFLTVMKFVAFLLSGSGAMLAEAVHSGADTGNQFLLYLGVRRSVLPPDSQFHYGYGAERFLFALLAAIGIFVLGCGVSVYHGVHNLMAPPELSFSWLTFAVLGVSLVVDLFVLTKAIAEMNEVRQDQSLREFMRQSSDPALLAVLFEDFVATTGVLVAAAGILLSHFTGNPVFDAIASIVIGLLLGAIAVWLGMKNRELLLGRAIPLSIQKEIVAYLESSPSIQRVRRVKTRIVGSEQYKIACEVDFDGRYLAGLDADWAVERMRGLTTDEDRRRFAIEFGEHLMDRVGAEVDRLEAELMERHPHLVHIEIETDWRDGD